jgi:aminopeptidase-like protein
LGYKESYVGNHLVDRAVRLAFRDQEIEPVRYPFAPDGSDERQYSSPGFRVPVTTITKDKYYEYPEYHTSMDNLDLVNGTQILEAIRVYQHAIEILDSNEQIKSKAPFGEPQLSSRGLYPTTGGAINQKSSSFKIDYQEVENIDLLTWVMFLADGDMDLISIAERSGHRFRDIKEMVAILRSQDLIETNQLPN